MKSGNKFITKKDGNILHESTQIFSEEFVRNEIGNFYSLEFVILQEYDFEFKYERQVKILSALNKVKIKTI